MRTKERHQNVSQNASQKLHFLPLVQGPHGAHARHDVAVAAQILRPKIAALDNVGIRIFLVKILR